MGGVSKKAKLLRCILTSSGESVPWTAWGGLGSRSGRVGSGLAPGPSGGLGGLHGTLSGDGADGVSKGKEGEEPGTKKLSNPEPSSGPAIWGLSNPNKGSLEAKGYQAEGIKTRSRTSGNQKGTTEGSTCGTKVLCNSSKPESSSSTLSTPRH